MALAVHEESRDRQRHAHIEQPVRPFLCALDGDEKSCPDWIGFGHVSKSYDSGNLGPNRVRHASSASPFFPTLASWIAWVAEWLAACSRSRARDFCAAIMPSLTGGPRPAGSGHLSKMRSA